MAEKAVLDIQDKPDPLRWIVLSLQHMFAMFGATILVPTLVGLSPAMALLTSGIATFIFVIVTRFQVPAYLGSSFAFIAPIIMIREGGGTDGDIMIGIIAVSLVYSIVSLVIWKTGHRWIMRLLPPIVVGPVIVVIGLGLAPTAIDMASMVPVFDELGNQIGSEYSLKHLTAAGVTLLTAVIVLMFFKGLISLMPVIVGIVVGYIYSLAIGIVDFDPVLQAKVFAMPEFIFPVVHYDVNISLMALSLMIPVVLVTISEHIGHQLVLGRVVNRNYIKDPGLHRSLLGDGLGTLISGLMGGPPKTTYGENIGVLAMTRVYSVYVILGAATFAIVFAFLGKVMALIGTIPTAVLGGVSILLFGMIAASGLRMLVEHQIDFDSQRNLVIASVILVIGIGGATLKFIVPVLNVPFELGGMALAAIVGVLLNLILPGRPKELIEE